MQSGQSMAGRYTRTRPGAKHGPGVSTQRKPAESMGGRSGNEKTQTTGGSNLTKGVFENLERIEREGQEVAQDVEGKKAPGGEPPSVDSHPQEAGPAPITAIFSG